MPTANQHSRFYFNFYRIALFNLLLVASIGSLLRFKMVASLPWIDHKYFLHGHSHFAFSGWISLVLMVAIVQHIESAGQQQIIPFFRKLLWVHLLCCYGMLLSFPVQGYAPVSIFFSTASIIVSYVFVAKIWRFCNATHWGSTASMAIRAALAFLALSSLGAFGLALLMATHAHSQPLYFSALYFFLHFQYNGWFFFGIVGLFTRRMAYLQPVSLQKGVKWLIISCIPAVMLSGLWMEVPVWVYLISGIVALAQVWGTFLLAKALIAGWQGIAEGYSKTERRLLKMTALAFLIRILLQALSTIPALSRFAFAYRPVVIGYLHLILLGCISLFLFSFLYGQDLWKKHRNSAGTGLIIFITGFLGTEGTLMAQGLGYIGWTSIPFTNEVLFGSAILLFSGIFVLFASSRQP